jgi:hypothetical protein
MKICPVGGNLLYADEHTDGQTDLKELIATEKMMKFMLKSVPCGIWSISVVCLENVVFQDVVLCVFCWMYLYIYIYICVCVCVCV